MGKRESIIRQLDCIASFKNDRYDYIDVMLKIHKYCGRDSMKGVLISLSQTRSYSTVFGTTFLCRNNYTHVTTKIEKIYNEAIKASK